MDVLIGVFNGGLEGVDGMHRTRSDLSSEGMTRVLGDVFKGGLEGVS